MGSAKRKRGAQRRSKKQHERHQQQKIKAKQDRRQRNKSSTRIYFTFKTLWGYIWKLIASVPVLDRFVQFVLSLLKDS